MAVVLGINFSHDASACVVKDGRLLCAVSKERIDRVKKSSGATKALIDYVLAGAGVTAKEVTHLATGGGYYKKDIGDDLHDDQYVQVAGYEKAHRQCPGAATYFTDTATLPDHGIAMPIYFVNHQLAHAASAFYTSIFENAACFALDASGPPSGTSLFAAGYGRYLVPLYCPGVQIGCTYGHFTEYLGLGPQITKAGTLMGLAPYGKVREVAREYLDLCKQSCFGRSVAPALADNHGSTFVFDGFMWSAIAGHPPGVVFDRSISDSKAAMDIAASMQFLFEEAIVHHANDLFKHSRGYNQGNICLSGGSFLNCDANSAIIDRTPFNNVHLLPACSDDGSAVGAALYVAHHVLGEPRTLYTPGEIVYTGRQYPTPQIGVPLDVEVIAKLIAEGGIVAWHQGRSEFGPRALGNRSILADPRRADIRDVMNFKIKRREWFRPFAPSVLREKMGEWFHFDRDSSYMLFKAQVIHPEKIPGVTHVDGSARIQTVTHAVNPRYHDLISAFDRLTGVPLLLNTSLNVNNEPLCEAPEDAIRFFDTTDVHALVIDDRMVLR